MVLESLRKLGHYYWLARTHKRRYVDWRWRALVFLVVVALFAYTGKYVQDVYFVVVNDVPTKVPFLLADRLMEYFAWGFFAGFLVFALLAEGEFVIGIRKLAFELTGGVGKSLQRVSGSLGPTGGKGRFARSAKGRRR